MKLVIDMDNASGHDDIPHQDDVYQWVEAALSTEKSAAEVSIRIVDEDESAELNQCYRNKQGPTNVLSFPAELPAFLQETLELPLLGDLVICAPVVQREAREQNKTLEAHWAHMLIHGSLHLIGYDHIDDQDAEKMERLETTILTGLNFPPPYEPYEQVPGEMNTK
jgi:probable rRNA maturation factor